MNVNRSVTDIIYTRMDSTKLKPISNVVGKCSVKERKDYLTEACRKEYGRAPLNATQLTLSQLSQISTHLLVDDKHKTVFCYVGKAGATTYKSLFVQYSDIYKQQYGDTEFGEHFVPDSVHHPEVFERFGLRSFSSLETPDEKRHVLNTYFKVFAARNPLSRIHSMYKNKLVDRAKQMRPGRCFRYNKYLGMDIIKEMRPHSDINNITCAVDVTFKEFATYYANNTRLQSDNHLIPVSKQCHPCLIQYDYFFKLETGDSDQRFLVEKVFGETGRNESRDIIHYNAGDHNSEDRWRNNNFQYHIADYDDLSDDVMNRLDVIYRTDLDLFGYKKTNKSSVDCSIQRADGTTCC